MNKLFHPAIETVGRTTLIIKDDKVIGKGVACVMRGNDFVSIRLDEGEVLEMVKDLETIDVLGLRNSYFRYSPLTGLFLGRDDADDEFQVLGETCIVDEFNFRYGLVPDIYASVEGYQSAFASLATEP